MQLRISPDKQLMPIISQKIYKNENNADKITLLIPELLNGYDMRDCTITIKFLNADDIGQDYIVVPEAEPYSGYLKYAKSITTDITYLVGDVRLWIEVTNTDDILVLKTNERIVEVLDSEDITVHLTPQNLDTLNQLKLDLDGKVDGATYINNILQLTSKGEPIGEPMTIVSGPGGGGDGRGITSIVKIGTVGLVDTYRITFTDTTTTTYTVTNGSNGTNGTNGAQGIQGLKGDTGTQGIQGIQGLTGAKGDTGEQGIQGIKGDTGLTGSQGIQGIKGDTGTAGTNGTNGTTPVEGVDYNTLPSTVNAASNIYAIDFANKISVNRRITTADTVAKTITVSNVPTETEMYLELVYTNASAITWFGGIVWLGGSAPTFTSGKTYRLGFYTKDAGTTWNALSVGGW